VKQFLPEHIVNFLRKIDEYLNGEVQIIVIGGAAASLAYGVTKATTDIDLATELSDDLSQAIKCAQKDTGILLPVTYVGLFEPPYNYEFRLTAIQNPKLNRLKVHVPERHDLALMKMVRGYENDIQAIVEIHELKPLEFGVLVDRFMDELGQVTGNPVTIRLNFLLMLENIFDKKHVQDAERITQEWSALDIATH